MVSQRFHPSTFMLFAMQSSYLPVYLRCVCQPDKKRVHFKQKYFSRHFWSVNEYGLVTKSNYQSKKWCQKEAGTEHKLFHCHDIQPCDLKTKTVPLHKGYQPSLTSFKQIKIPHDAEGKIFSLFRVNKFLKKERLILNSIYDGYQVF